MEMPAEVLHACWDDAFQHPFWEMPVWHKNNLKISLDITLYSDSLKANGILEDKVIAALLRQISIFQYL